MNDKINVVYIDDELDYTISGFFEELSSTISDEKINYTEVKFKKGDDYTTLIYNPVITNSNIIIIDSMLFEQKTVTKNKFTGEEFKLILKKEFPFIEIIVITQNIEEIEKYGKIRKLRSINKEDPKEYIDKVLEPVYNEAVEKIKVYRNINDRLQKSGAIDNYIKECVSNSMDGINTYDKLTSAEIDKIVELFKELQNV